MPLDPLVFSRPGVDPAKNLTVSSGTEGEWEQGGSGGMLPWGKFWDHLLRISCLNLDICWTIFPNFLIWTEEICCLLEVGNVKYNYCFFVQVAVMFRLLREQVTKISQGPTKISLLHSIRHQVLFWNTCSSLIYNVFLLFHHIHLNVYFFLTASSLQLSVSNTSLCLHRDYLWWVAMKIEILRFTQTENKKNTLIK